MAKPDQFPPQHDLMAEGRQAEARGEGGSAVRLFTGAWGPPITERTGTGEVGMFATSISPLWYTSSTMSSQANGASGAGGGGGGGALTGVSGAVDHWSHCPSLVAGEAGGR